MPNNRRDIKDQIIRFGILSLFPVDEGLERQFCRIGYLCCRAEDGSNWRKVIKGFGVAMLAACSYGILPVSR